MNKEVFKPKGIIPALVTPTDEWGKLNEDALRKLVNYVIEGGVHGLFPLGSQGEFYALDFQTKKRVLEVVVEETAGRVPVYAGTGAVTTDETIKLTQMAQSIGVNAVSIITPYFINPNEVELYEHYETIAQSCPDLPILLYGNQGRTGVGLSPDLVVKCSRIDNIIGIKDSSGDLTLSSEYIRRTGDGFHVLTGRDTLIYATLCSGGVGSITASANVIPKLVVKIYESFVTGDLEKALAAQYRLAPLRLAFSLGTFPVVIKEALNIIGIEAGSAIRPVRAMSPGKRRELETILKDLEVL